MITKFYLTPPPPITSISLRFFSDRKNNNFYNFYKTSTFIHVNCIISSSFFIAVNFMVFLLSFFYRLLKNILINANNNFFFFFKNSNMLFFVSLFGQKSSFLKLHQLTDLILTDQSNQNFYNNYVIYYSFLSLIYSIRIFYVFPLISNNVKIFSIQSIYSCSNWLEREVFDMFGFYFDQHSDLRRILTDYGFQGYPLRKEFPVFGFFELSYNSQNYLLSYKKINHFAF